MFYFVQAIFCFLIVEEHPKSFNGTYSVLQLVQDFLYFSSLPNWQSFRCHPDINELQFHICLEYHTSQNTDKTGE